MRSLRAGCVGSLLVVPACRDWRRLRRCGAADVTVFARGEPQGGARRAGAGSSRPRRGNKVVVSYGASNALAKQIEAGAPADLFISADLDWMDYLDQRKLLVPGHARQSAAQYARADRAGVEHGDAQDRARISASPRRSGTEKLAMANPGQRARRQVRQERAREAGRVDRRSRSRSRAPRTCAPRWRWCRAAKRRSASSIATDALADKGVRIVDTFPADSHPPIVYPAALLAGEQVAARRSRCSTTCARPPRARCGSSTASGWRNSRCSDSAPTSSASSR